MNFEHQNKQEEPEVSLLDTNSALAEAPVSETPAAAKSKIKTIAAVLLAVLLVVGVVVGGGLISEQHYQKQLAEEQARELRDGEEIKYLTEVPELVEGELQSGVTALYYTQENGLMVTLEFINGKDKSVSVEQVSVTLRDGEGNRIASAEAALKNVTVAADESVEHNLYIKPNLVAITDSTLDIIDYAIEVTEAEAA